jgi:hypothetical protein
MPTRFIHDLYSNKTKVHPESQYHAIRGLGVLEALAVTLETS